VSVVPCPTFSRDIELSALLRRRGLRARPETSVRPRKERLRARSGFRETFRIPQRSDAPSITSIALKEGTIEKKIKFIQAAAPTKRGTNASLMLQQQLLDQIEELESLNPSPEPADSEHINGWWSLIYQSTPEPSLKWDPNTEVEGPFLAALKPFNGLAKELVKGKGNFQKIDTNTGEVQNLAQFNVFGKPGYLNIFGSCERVSATRVNVRFESVDLRIKGVGQWNVSLSWVNPEGWVETTYLDSDFRIGRGDKGSVFVAARTKGDPTNL